MGKVFKLKAGGGGKLFKKFEEYTPLVFIMVMILKNQVETLKNVQRAAGQTPSMKSELMKYITTYITTRIQGG